MSGQDYGGLITVRLSTGTTLSLRGTLNINPARMSAEAQTNDDGSVDRIGTNRPATAEINFADRGIDYDALMRSSRFNVTFIETFSGVTHYFTEAFMAGDPQLNRKTGEVTGLTINAEKYSKVKN
ncbi:phage tail tube protein [Rhizobium sp. CNPSo 4039]|uniref:phage tail tube protein n=1 Tax=Rhizobium sp. CNPSo 4039 TaxID=3021409 RepID=UPI00254A8CB2|nr:phage tail tube protein [Rhizobium sp. CNPSo 4039]MDK4712992.1 phage tail tube protein [Rhizobium sp. CNPSo 4039]